MRRKNQLIQAMWWESRQKRKSKKAQKSLKLEWLSSPDIDQRLRLLCTKLDLHWLDLNSVYTFRSHHAKTQAVARIWGLSRVWQIALKIKPSYVLEVVSEKFDRLSQAEKDKVLLHELVHIPRNFSGALMPHRKGKGGFHDRLRKMITMYNKLS